MSPRWKNAIALIVSLLFAAVACEVAARLVLARPPDPAREPQILYTPDPEAGYVHVPNQQGWIDEGWVTINTLGCRGKEPRVPKPVNGFRVLVVGDSVTLGWGVGDSEAYPAVLEQALQRAKPGGAVDVVNCAVSGYNTPQQARQIARLAPVLVPDIVLVGFYWNDLPNLLARNGHVAALPDRRDPAQADTPFRLGVQPTRVGSLLRRSRALYGMKGAFRIVRGLWAEPDSTDIWNQWEAALLEPTPTPIVEEAWGQGRDRLIELAAVAARHRTRVALVLLPSRTQSARPDGSMGFRRRVMEAGAAAGLPVIDLFPTFTTRRDRLSSLYIQYDRDHPNAAGHRLIAEALLAELQQLRARGYDAPTSRIQ